MKRPRVPARRRPRADRAGPEAPAAGRIRRCGTVSDGRALLKAAGELLPDVVVVDIGMPLLNGLDAGEQLKALHPGIKIVFLTQNREPRFAVEAFRRQACSLSPEDWPHPSSTTAIQDAVNGKTYISPAIARSMGDELPAGVVGSILASRPEPAGARSPAVARRRQVDEGSGGRARHQPADRRVPQVPHHGPAARPHERGAVQQAIKLGLIAP